MEAQYVSLLVGAAMLAITLRTYRRYVCRTFPEPPPATPPRSADGPTPLMLRPAVTGMVAMHGCIGLQQVFEGLAFEYDRTWLYKLSLSVSLLAFLFGLQSLEHLTRRSYASSAAGTVIVAAALWNSFQPMEHGTGTHFWASDAEKPPWGAAWLGLFIYWNVCLFQAVRSAFSKEDARLLRVYGLAMLNGSVIVALVYAFVAEAYASARELLHQGVAADELGWPWRDVLGGSGSEMMVATPAVWCIVSGLQTVALPFYLRALRAGYVHDLPPVKSSRGALFLVYVALLAGLVTWAAYALSDNAKDFAAVMVRR